MKPLKVSLLFPFVLLLAACGGMTTGGVTNTTLNASNSMNGNWATTMMNSSGAQMMAFTSTMSQSSGNVVTAMNLQFTTPTSCFASGTSGTGAAMLSTGMNGSMT